MSYASDYANNVSNLLQQQGQNRAAILGAKGVARQQLVQGVGQALAGIPGGIAAVKQAEVEQAAANQQQKLRGLQITQAQGEVDDANNKRGQEMILANAMRSSVVNGKLDHSKLQSTLLSQGVDPTPVLMGLAKADESAAKAREAKAAADLAEADYFGNLAAEAKASGYNPIVFFGALEHAALNGHNTQSIADRVLGGMPIKQVIDGVLAGSLKQRELADKERGTAMTGERLAAELPGIRATSQINQNVAGGMVGGLTQAQQQQLAQSAASLDETKRHNRVDEGVSAQRLNLERLKGTGQLTPNAALEATMSLKRSYDKETSASATVQQQLANMRSALEQARKGNMNAGSQGVLVTFQKILDPTSVVRESEYARSGEGLGLFTRLQGAAEKLSKGGAGVPVKDLEDFVRMAEDFAANQKAFADQQGQQIRSIASDYGLKPEHIIREPVKTGGPKVGERRTVGTETREWTGSEWKLVK